MTCMDLCAAAAYRLTGAAALSHGRESDLQHLLQSVKQEKVTLAASQDAWLHALVGSADWQLLKKARTAVTHREIESLSVLGVGPAVTNMVIDGKPYDNIELPRRFAGLAESKFGEFTAAVLHDFP
jgi:hypothetical protein